VTYATLSADNDDLHAAYEQGLLTARSWFGSTLPVYVDGESRTTGETFEVRSPVDTSIVLCRVHSATPADVADAVAAASSGRRLLGGDAMAGAREAATRRSRSDQRAIERAGPR
jgi:delta 1-pyrroline-5-carboxylate dehydrogenase